MDRKDGRMNKTLVIVIIAVAVLLIGGVGGGFYMIWNKLADLDARIQSEEVDDEEDRSRRPRWGPCFHWIRSSSIWPTRKANAI